MYVLHAIRRAKENTGLPHKSIRLPSTDIAKDIETIKSKISREEGTWRIYRSVNKRDVFKTYKWMQHKMLDDTDMFHADRLDRLWTKGLMQPENKAERLYLVDVDSKDAVEVDSVVITLNILGVKIDEIIETPNGFHIVANPFDVRDLDDCKYTEVKKDALLFIERVEND